MESFRDNGDRWLKRLATAIIVQATADYKSYSLSRALPAKEFIISADFEHWCSLAGIAPRPLREHLLGWRSNLLSRYRDDERVLRLREQGYSARAISRRLGINRAQVQCLLNRVLIESYDPRCRLSA